MTSTCSWILNGGIAVISGLTLIFSASAGSAEPRLEPLTLKLDGIPRRVSLIPWNGRMAALVFTLPLRGSQDTRALEIVTVAQDALRITARWRLPREVNWVEPLARPGEPILWLALIGDDWMVGRIENGELRWQRACECPSPYPRGDRPSENSRFVADLDGDGRDEVLLPEREGLRVYTVVEGPPHLKPLRLKPLRLKPQWIDRWKVREQRRVRKGRDKITIELPRHILLDVDGDGVLDLVRMEPERLLVTPHPRPGAAHGVTASPTAYAVTFPGLGRAKPNERRAVLAVADMNGDGIPDVLHHRVINPASTFSQRNQLRWYAGRRQGGRLVLADSPRIFRSEGPGFAQAVSASYPSRGIDLLILASAETGWAANARALASGSAILHMEIYPWRNGELARKPVRKGKLAFSLNRSGGGAPALLMSDLDGDGWREILLNRRSGRLDAYRGSPKGPRIGAKPFATGEMRLPKRRERLLVADLDGQPGEEVLIWYRDTRMSDDDRRILRVVRLVDRPAARRPKAPPVAPPNDR